MSSTEEIIEKVREHPILYDLSHSEYKNVKKKDKIWDEIAMSLGGMTGDELKKKWKNLRDSFAKYLRSEKTKTGQEMKILDRYKMWPWAQQMEFLRHSLTFAKTHSNVSSVRQPVSEPIEDTNEQDQPSTQTAEKNHPPVDHSSVAENIDESEPQRKKNRQPPVENQQEKKKKKPNNSQSSSVEQVISYLDRNKDKSIVDDIDDIFKGYVKTIKKFSKKRQAIVKFKISIQRISQLIMEQELAQLEEEEQHVHNISASTSVSRSNSAESYSFTPFVPSSHASQTNTYESNERSAPSSWYENFGASVNNFPSDNV